MVESITSDEVVKPHLTRSVPARTETTRFNWIKADFSVYNAAWRAVRAKMRTPLDHCRWCKHKFKDGEQIGLAGPEKGANWVLCQKCVTEAQTL